MHKVAFLLLLLLPPAVSAQQAGSAKSPAKVPKSVVETPAVVTAFVKAVGDEADGETFREHALEWLWQVYPNSSSLKDQLVAYVQKGPDGPGLGFAGLALIPFHDPATVRPMLERALDQKLHPMTRWCFLNAAPYILAMGDVWSDAEEKKFDRESREFAKNLIPLAGKASREGLGRQHAAELRKMHDDVPQKEKDSDPDYGLALWHASAYLVGTLDLRDEVALRVFLDPSNHNVFANVMSALSFATNRNFLAPLQAKEQVARPEELDAAAKARFWWQEYLRAHPDGDWLPAVLDGFREAGFSLEADLRSPQSTRELLRGLEAGSEITRYNAARLLNYTYGTHFDLERIFMAGKYALGPFDPSTEVKNNEAKLKSYWQQRLKENAQP